MKIAGREKHNFLHLQPSTVVKILVKCAEILLTCILRVNYYFYTKFY